MTIVLLGENDNGVVAKSMCSALGKYFRIFLIVDGVLEERGSGDKNIVIVDTEKIGNILVEKAIIISKHSRFNCLVTKIKQAVVLLDCKDKYDFTPMSGNELNIISVGTADKNTITFSSNQDDFVVISLLRSIKNFNGEIIEPQEIVIEKHTNTDDYIYLYAVAILLLTNEQSGMAEKTNKS